MSTKKLVSSSATNSLIHLLKNYNGLELKQEVIEANYMQLEAIERLCSFLEFVHNSQHRDAQGNLRTANPNLKTIIREEYVKYTVYTNTVSEPRTVLSRLNSFYRLIGEQYKDNAPGLQQAIIDLLCNVFRYTIDFYQATNTDQTLNRRTKTYNDLFSAKQLVEFILVVFPQLVADPVDASFVHKMLVMSLKLGLSFTTIYDLLVDHLDADKCSATLDKDQLQTQYLAYAYACLNLDPSCQLQSSEHIVKLLQATESEIHQASAQSKLAQELEFDHLQSARAAALVLADHLTKTPKA